MFYQPELIIYLWLLPVTLLIVIPAALATLRVVMSIMKNTSAEEEYSLEQGAFANA